ncbi:IPP transferase-domain-containing protein, partial [Hyaloraphidium curvatum]
GKSQLALDLAQRLSLSPLCSPGSPPLEIISADSMQVYASLPIATNHPTPEDFAKVRHHLVGHLDHTMEYTAPEFVRDALDIIERIRAEGGRGVVVAGGTGYYVQSLLFRNTLTSGAFLDSAEPSAPADGAALAHPSTPAATLHSLLSFADPPVALLRHPNDVRKVRRSLEVFLSQGAQSELWEAQKREREGASSLRFRTVLLWVYSPPERLDPRLDARVDAMIERGLLEELAALKPAVERGELPASKRVEDGDGTSTIVDWTRGIGQAIGFKEFSDHLGLASSGNPAAADPERSLADGLERMRQRTRRYARTQLQWLRNRLAPAVLREEPLPFPGTGLRAGDAHALPVDDRPWDEIVVEAENRVLAFLEATPASPSADSVLASLLSASGTRGMQPHVPCPVCTDDEGKPRMIPEGQFEDHLKSRAHRGQERRRRNRSQREMWKARSAAGACPISDTDQSLPAGAVELTGAVELKE